MWQARDLVLRSVQRKNRESSIQLHTLIYYIVHYHTICNKKMTSISNRAIFPPMEKAERLKILRLLRGLTQTELAAQAGLPQASLASMERGKYSPVGDTGMSIAAVLGVPFDYLYSGTPVIDFQHPVVWSPKPPPRPQHFQTFTNDVRQLFPRFLDENRFNVVMSSELGDGGFLFLIGRPAAASDFGRGKIILPEDVKPPNYLFSCLLLVESRLSVSFKVAFTSSKMEILESNKLSNCTVESLNENDVENIIPGGIRTNPSIKKLCDTLIFELSTKKSTYLTSQPHIGKLFNPFFRIVKEYSFASGELEEISDFFVSKCHAIEGLTESEIDITQLEKEIHSKLESLGCKKTSEPVKIIKESDDHDYLLVKEWLRELWLDAEEDKKTSLLKMLKENTDYEKWVEKFNQDVAEGKRAPLAWIW